MALRLTSTGHLDPHFGGGGVTIVPGTSINNSSSMTVPRSGRVVLVGTGLPPPAPALRRPIVRLTARGQLDPSFGSDGLVSDKRPAGLPGHRLRSCTRSTRQQDCRAGSSHVPRAGEAGRVSSSGASGYAAARFDFRPRIHRHHRVRLKATVTRAGTTIVKVQWRFGDGRTARGLRSATASPRSATIG